MTGPFPPKDNNLRLNNIKFVFDASLIPTAVEIHMSQFKHSYGKHTPILHVQENKLQKDLCPVKALCDYLQLCTAVVAAPIRKLCLL
jgi:hypothetical protein